MCNGMRKSRSKYLNLGSLFFDEKTTQGYRKTENHKKNRNPTRRASSRWTWVGKTEAKQRHKTQKIKMMQGIKEIES